MGDVDLFTQEPFAYPFVASDGQTYELESLKEYLRTKWDRASPYTRETLRPWAFWDAPLALRLGLPEPQRKVAVLYEGPPVTGDSICAESIIECRVNICQAQCISCDWLATAMSALSLLSRVLQIQAVLRAPEPDARDARPSVVGYPVAANLADRLRSFCDTFLLSRMWQDTQNLASAPVSLLDDEGGAHYMCNLEELLNDPVLERAWQAHLELRK